MRAIRWAPVRPMVAAALTSLVVAIGCGPPPDSPRAASGQTTRIRLTSAAFTEGQPIPSKYTGEGDNLSPPLSWSGVPEGTRELALVCDDPDAPAGTWVHWVIAKIPATATGLPEGVGRIEQPEQNRAGWVEGRNSFGASGYGGPMPPRGGGPHRFYFRLYALDCELAPDPGLDKASLLRAIDGHVLGEGELMGTYAR